MAIIPVNNAAENGIISDLLPMQLPPNAWSTGTNVRFKDNKVVKFTGHEEYFDPGTDWDGVSGNQVYFAIPYNDGSEAIWVYCGLNDVVATNGTTSEEITNTGGDYTATAKNGWTGGVLSSFLILNNANGVDDPQTWTGVYNPPASSATLVDLLAWPASTTCKVMRVYKNYLVALDVTKGATRYKSLVKWSDSAALGALPTSWDETDATTDAGETDLSEKIKDVNVGAVIDCMPLRDSNIVYTDSQVWLMDFIGGDFVFAFRQLFKNNGILTSRCAQEFEGKHFVVGQGDVYVHDGTTFKSVIDAKRRRFLFNDMDGSNYETTYVFANYEENEMWICYPRAGSATPLPTVALVWNWRNGSWGQRNLINTPLFGTPHISSGIVDTSIANDAWNAIATTWATVDRIWNITTFSPQEQAPLICADKLYKGDATNTFDGVAFEASVERTDIPISEQDQFVRLKVMYPKMEGSASVNIHVGSQMAPSGSVDWGVPMVFTPGTDLKIDVRKTGTHAAVKVESSGDQDWEMSGYELEVEAVGRRGSS